MGRPAPPPVRPAPGLDEDPWTAQPPLIHSQDPTSGPDRDHPDPDPDPDPDPGPGERAPYRSRRKRVGAGRTTGALAIVRPPGSTAVERIDLNEKFDQTLDTIDRETFGRHYDRLMSNHPGPKWQMVAAVSAVLVAIVAGIAFLAQYRSTGDGVSARDGAAGPLEQPTVDQLAQSTVQILGLDRNGQAVCSGSGTFVTAGGMILTNAHVITRDSVCDFVSIGIAVTDDADRPPRLLYLADTVAVDHEVDLAVLQVSSAVSDTDPLPDMFPALALGDSDTLTIGDDVRILGYPEIGGETITFTNGSVSGFTAQANLGDRALIKTDATIAGGNSGGAAVDTDGQLIGIPTKARASESGPAVDCRPLVDTNSDGEVDAADSCVPIGGFLNGIRPINLARDLIAEATGVGSFDEASVRVEVDVGDVRMSRPRFSLGESDNSPAEIVVTAAAGVSELCLFVDWSGIPNGAEWDGIWYYNTESVEAFSKIGQRWEFGPQGNNFWMCAIDDDNGLDPGLYELGFFLGSELVFAEGIVLTEGPVPIYTTTWENTTEVDICELAINPKGSGPVGLNELAPGLIIRPGEIASLDLPQGEVVVKAYGCDGEPLADSGGIPIEQDKAYYIEIPE